MLRRQKDLNIWRAHYPIERIKSQKMRINKKVLAAIIIGVIATSIILPVTIIFSFTNFLISPDVKYTKGFQVSYEEVPPSDPIVILNPKGTSIFYRSRYMGIHHSYIFLNYRTAPGVIAEEYILDGEASQLIPQDNVIPTPENGNHTLMLIGTNSTGDSCNSTRVNFNINNKVPGICGASAECYDYTYSSTVRFAISRYGFGLITETIFDQELFLEGPEKPIFVQEYIQNVDLTFDALGTYFPLIVLRSEPWYNHTVHIENSHWVNLISGGEIVDRIWLTSGFSESAKNGITKILYFRADFLHVVGNVTYWNGETRYYDVFCVETIPYDNIYAVSYGANETILDVPTMDSVDFSQFSGEYYDKYMNENNYWQWGRNENWLESYGIEASVFLGNYAGEKSCPVPVTFTLPQTDIINHEMIPNEIIHTFTRTGEEPENYDANLRGLENALSLNIIPI
jgi:hypothetical protein